MAENSFSLEDKVAIITGQNLAVDGGYAIN